MKTVKLLFIIILFALFSCADSGSSGSESEEAESESTEDTTTATATGTSKTTESIEYIETTVVYNITGKPEKGYCFKDGEVIIHPLDDGSFEQLPGYTGYTDDNGFNVPVEIDDEYSEIFFTGFCDDEVNGGDGFYRVSGIVKNSDPVKNINPLTKIRSIVARDLFGNEFGTTEESLTEAESMILNYMSMPVLEKQFTELSIENDSTDDAILLIAASALCYNKTDAGCGDHMIEIANGVISNDLDLRAGFVAIYDELPIFDIIDNLKASYGEETKIPPLWRLISPNYFADLIENEHTLQGSFNIPGTGSCNVDLPYNTYAIPHVFESWIETSKYIAFNLDGDVSIWTRTFSAYDRPGVKLLDIERLEGISLEGPANLIYNGKAENHGLTTGTDYYIVISRGGEGWHLSTGCDGGILVFGRKLASMDGGQNWNGWNNNSTWFRKSGLRMFGLN